jgi:hypothetical protein
MKTINVEIEVPEGFDPVLCMKITNLAGQTPFNFRIVAAPEHPAAEVGTRILHAKPVRVCPICDIAECRTHAPEPAGAGAVVAAECERFDTFLEAVAEANRKIGAQDMVIADLQRQLAAPATPQPAQDEKQRDADIRRAAAKEICGIQPMTPEQISSRARQFGERVKAISDAEKAIQAATSPAHLYRSDPDHGE